MQALILPKIDCENLIGQFLDERHYTHLIDHDVDVFSYDHIDHNLGEGNVILKFRKGYFTKAEQEGAYDGLVGAAKLSNNRGMAAGPVGERLRHLVPVNGAQLNILEHLLNLPDSDMLKLTKQDIEDWRTNANLNLGTRTLVWLGDSVEEAKFNFEEWLESLLTMNNVQARLSADNIWNTFISDTNYANPVLSGIAGYFGRYPRRPWGGPTAYTEQNMEKFRLSWPFLKSLGRGFRELLPERAAVQFECASRLDPKFVIPETPFTTITVNKNFRTAAHRDAGDLASGFSNLTVVAKNKDYTGGYLILPEIRAAVNIRPGDLLLVSNHEYIHGNTPISGGENFERISLVCYFRENMLELETAEYEELRHEFVENRRLARRAIDSKSLWNGISPDMWNSDEWRDYIDKHGKPYMMNYHPQFNNSSLVDLFA